ncbi:MAG: hypothetical protein FWG56_02395 [Desulfovibrionaceae bacterium]|nr:hypothetical protein [Desulfovibrionaceae bacterium]
MTSFKSYPAAAAALLLSTTLLAGDLPADDIVRSPVHDARPVMLAALESPDGTAHGVLTGEVADAITRQFKANSPIYIDVSTQKRYRQSGCARLSVVFWQEGVKLPEAASARKQTIEFGINYCLDGRPPQSMQ